MRTRVIKRIPNNGPFTEYSLQFASVLCSRNLLHNMLDVSKTISYSLVFAQPHAGTKGKPRIYSLSLNPSARLVYSNDLCTNNYYTLNYPSVYTQFPSILNKNWYSHSLMHSLQTFKEFYSWSFDHYSYFTTV